ncbi:EamA family transporter [Vibrio sp. RW]|nr:EamA family transporter [Vibrio sp. RW]MDA0144096.1 EamA family transporter [Vibrio sp. RW]
MLKNYLTLIAIGLIWGSQFVFQEISLEGFSPVWVGTLRAILIYLGVLCAGVVYYLYMMSIKNAGAVFTSMTNYLVPAVGVLIGVLLADESVQTTTWLALVVILSALFINQTLAKSR